MRFRNQESKIKHIDKLTISLASPDEILSRSHGEVTKPETINYRSFRPEKDGLFCEKILVQLKIGNVPVENIKELDIKELFVIDVVLKLHLKSVRRERMGHIDLAVPVVHIWFFKVTAFKNW